MNRVKGRTVLIYSLEQEQFESDKGKTVWAFVEQ